MRIGILTFLSFCFAFTGWSQNQFEKELKTQIDEVTVYISGGLITRSGKLEIPDGQSVVKIKSLSPHMDAKSIQVKATGDFTILAVNHSINYLNSLKKEQAIDSLKQEFERIEFKIATAEARLQILSEKQSLLDKNKKLGGESSGASLTQLKQAIDFYDRELTAIKTEDLNTRLDIKALQLQKDKLLQEISKTQGLEELPSGEIEIRLSATTKTTGSFTVSYLVSQTGWYPKYDIRVKNVAEPLTLNYKADIYQNTGVDWDNVTLKLSNGNPNLSGVAPELKPWYINFARNTIFNRASYELASGLVRQVSGTVWDENGDPLPGANVMVQGSTVGTQTDFDGNYSLTLPNGATQLSISYLGFSTAVLPINSSTLNVHLQEDAAALEEVVVTGYSLDRRLAGRAAGLQPMAVPKKAETIKTTTQENQTTVAFEVDRPYSIKSKGEKLTVDLNSFDIETRYEYYAVPKLDSDAFLMARIWDWDQYNLLEGEANLYFEEAYVGRSVLDARSLSDTLSISLGRDKSISIGREKIDDFSKRKAIGSNKIESRGYKITARNKKSQPVTLTLFDQLPVAAISEITVTPGNLSGGLLNEKTGEVKWELELQPQQQKEVTLGFEVKYPKYEKVVLE